MDLEKTMKVEGVDAADDEEDLAQHIQVYEGRLKMKLEMMAADLTRSASYLSPPPSSSMFPRADEKGVTGKDVAEADKGVAKEADTTDAASLMCAFVRASEVGNLRPTFTHIKGYLAEAGKNVNDEKIKYLCLRVQEKGWQELCAYLYEVQHSLPPGTGHQYFIRLDKERQIFPTKDTHKCGYGTCGSTSLVAEKDASPVAKRLKCSVEPKPYYSARWLVDSAYFKATAMQKIKHPTFSDIKRIVEDLRQCIPDAVSVPDEEIESIMSEIRASGIYDGMTES